MKTKNKKTRRENGQGTIWQTQNGKWHHRRLLGINPQTGKNRYITGHGQTRAAARIDLEHKIRNFETQGALPLTGTPTFSEYCDRWLTLIQKQVKPRVYETYKGEINTIVSQLGGLRLDKVEATHIEYTLDQLSIGRSSKTIHNYYIRIRQILTTAVQHKLITYNPAHQVTPPRYEIQDTLILEQGQPAQAIKAINHVTTPNSALANATDEEKHMWTLLWQLAFETGMRQAERFGLTPSELVTRDGIHGIEIRHQLQYLKKDTIIPNWLPATHIQGNYYLLPPKTKQGKRFIPISTLLWIQLNERIQKQHIKPNQLIFTLDNKPLNSVKERRRWKQALDAAGLPYTTMRAARHFFSTHLAQTGASEDARTSMMGHAKITTTAGYTHWSPETLAALADQARQAINQ